VIQRRTIRLKLAIAHSQIEERRGVVAGDGLSAHGQASAAGVETSAR
jgi:hypothetical protein